MVSQNCLSIYWVYKCVIVKILINSILNAFVWKWEACKEYCVQNTDVHVMGCACRILPMGSDFTLEFA